MKKRTCRIIALILMACLVFALFPACGGEDKSNANTNNPQNTQHSNDKTGLTEKITLSLSHHDGAESMTGVQWKNWADAIYEDSNGMIEIEVYHGASLVSPDDGLNALDTGICDILWTSVGFFPGQFPCNEAFGYPFAGIEDGVTGTKIFWDAYESIPEIRAEWENKGYMMLECTLSYPAYFFSTSEIKKPSDTKGLILRELSGLPTVFLETAGASPINNAPPEFYTSLEKGVMDGVGFDLAGVEGFRLNEVIDYVMDLPLYPYIMPVLMKQSTWDSLPEAAQEIIARHSFREGSIEFAANWDAVAVEEYESLKAAGKVVAITEEEADQWRQVGVDTMEIWIARNTSADLDYQAVVDGIVEIIDSYYSE